MEIAATSILAVLLTTVGSLTNFTTGYIVKEGVNLCDCNLLSQHTVEVDCSGQEGHLLDCFRSIRDQSVDDWDRLVIRRVKFRTLELSGFDFLAKIRTLEVIGCSFEEVLFRGMPALSSVHLLSSGLRRVKKEWFQPLPSLQQLHLVNNSLTSLPDNFTQDLATLQHLNVSRNQFATLEPTWFGFSPNLTALDVSRNQLTQLEDSNNSLALWERNVPGLKVLSFSWNQVASLFDTAFESQPNLTELHMDHNELEGLPSRFRSSNPHLNEVYLGDNPWQCIRQQSDPLHSWVALQKEGAAVAVPDAEAATCSSPPEAVGQIIFLYSYELCRRCSCVVRGGNLKFEVNCSSTNMRELPPRLPPGTQAVTLTHNHITTLSLPSDNEGWEEVLALDLDHNAVSDPVQVDPVKLSRNFGSLLELRLRFNRLTQLPSYVVGPMCRTPCDVYLEGNPWHCDCGTRSFVASLTGLKPKDMDDIRCGNSSGPRLEGKAIYLLKGEELCPQDGVVNRLLGALVAFMGVVILVILAKLFVDYRQQKRTVKLLAFFYQQGPT